MKHREYLQIRAASPSDLEAVQIIGRETYVEHFSALWSENNLEHFLQRDFSNEALQKSLASPLEHSWLLAEDSSGSIVGYAKINWNGLEPISGVLGAELQKIYFRSSAAGRGFGVKLIKFIVDASTERDQSKLWLEVLKSNTGAQRFYANCGFEHSGEIPFSTDIGEIGMVVMVRQLTANNSFKPNPLRGLA